MNKPDALRRCLDPITERAFFSEYWESSPLHLARLETMRFLDLISIDTIDAWLASEGMLPPFVKLYRAGGAIPFDSFQRSGPDGRMELDHSALLALFHDGATLVLGSLEEHHPPLRAFCRSLLAELGFGHARIHANAYLTPPSARGFDPHYDTHDVFILQVEGTKRWKVYESPLPLPMPSQTYEQHRDAIAHLLATGSPMIDACLSPGDTLFIPRGAVHWAETEGVASLHLTIGLHAQTKIDLLRAALNQRAAELEADPAWTEVVRVVDLEQVALRSAALLDGMSFDAGRAALAREPLEHARALEPERLLI